MKIFFDLINPITMTNSNMAAESLDGISSGSRSEAVVRWCRSGRSSKVMNIASGGADNSGCVEMGDGLSVIVGIGIGVGSCWGLGAGVVFADVGRSSLGSGSIVVSQDGEGKRLANGAVNVSVAGMSMTIQKVSD